MRDRSALARTLYNLLGYQAVWFAAVGGAGHALWWAGPLAAAVFAAGHFGWAAGPADRGADARLMALAAVCGLVLDGALSWSGLITYRGDAVTLPPGGAPAWILAMWMAFALTLRHSLGEHSVVIRLRDLEDTLCALGCQLDVRYPTPGIGGDAIARRAPAGEERL